MHGRTDRFTHFSAVWIKTSFFSSKILPAVTIVALFSIRMVGVHRESILSIRLIILLNSAGRTDGLTHGRMNGLSYAVQTSIWRRSYPPPSRRWSVNMIDNSTKKHSWRDAQTDSHMEARTNLLKLQKLTISDFHPLVTTISKVTLEVKLIS